MPVHYRLRQRHEFRDTTANGRDKVALQVVVDGKLTGGSENVFTVGDVYPLRHIKSSSLQSEYALVKSIRLVPVDEIVYEHGADTGQDVTCDDVLFWRIEFEKV